MDGVEAAVLHGFDKGFERRQLPTSGGGHEFRSRDPSHNLEGLDDWLFSAKRGDAVVTYPICLKSFVADPGAGPA